MMVTDDTFQDEQQVLAAKALLYREHLPEHIKKAHFVSDGAGCYKSKLHRTIMPCWETWTGIVELTYRITPAGDGKSVLDGMFARMNNCLATAVNEGGSHHNAETTIEMADAAGGMAATEFVRFAPDRSTNISVNNISIASVLLTVFHPESRVSLAYDHSSYGNGREIDPTELTFTVTKNGERDDSTLYNDDRTVNIDVVEAIAPKCSLQELTRTLKSEMPSSIARTGEGKGDSQVRIQVSKNRVKKRVAKKKKSVEDIRQEKRDAGLILCDARCPKTNRYCRKVFLKKQKEGFECKHNFPKGINAKDSLLLMASSHGGIVTVGSRVDRSLRAVTGPIIAATDNSKAEISARCYGCFNRKRAAAPYKKPDKLKDVLVHLFNSDVKMNAKAMREAMKNMRDDNGGLLFCYKKRRTNGLLLTEGQITSWVSTRTQEQKKKDKEKGPSGIDLQQQELVDGMDTAE